MHPVRALIVVFALAPALPAQDKSPEVKKQKDAAVEHLKQANLTGLATVETPNLLVFTTLPSDKAKPVADAGQKAFDAARKALKIDDKEKLWTGKLTVYVLPERKEFAAFARHITGRKVDADDSRAVAVRGDEPHAIIGLAAGAKVTDAAVRDEVTAAVAVAVLDQKAGVGAGTFTLPSWLQTGFGKAVTLRMVGNGNALEAHRTKVKGLFAKPRVGTFQATNVWGDPKPKDAETLTVSLVEYLVYGADAAKFAKFLGGYKPSDTRLEPDTSAALEAADWKPETLDLAWKTWVTKPK